MSAKFLSFPLSFLVPGHPITELELKVSQTSYQKAAWQIQNYSKGH